MSPSTRLSIALLPLAVACAEGEWGHEDIALDHHALSTENALSTNALTSNALTSNALTSNALTSNALTSNALTSNALTSNALTSNALTSNGRTEGEIAREMLTYIYSCAMPAGTSMTLIVGGTNYGVLQGGVGLAPEWATGACDETCQRWISACLLARTNEYGARIGISLRGSHPALAVNADEESAYAVREGGYFGNVFASSPVMYACAGPGSHQPDTTLRYCSSPTDDCPILTLTDCFAPSCGGELQSCDEAGCYDVPLACGSAPDPAATLFTEVITVYLNHPAPVCGNGMCDVSESSAACPADCEGWAHRIGGKGDESSIGGLAIDASGNTIMAGEFQGTVDLGKGPTTTAGWTAMYLTKYDAAGVQLWARSVGPVYPYAIATDAANNIYVGGTFAGSVSVGGATMTSVGWSDGFIAKYDAAGQHVWSRSFPATSASWGASVQGIAVGPAGFLAVTFTFNGGLTLDAVTLWSSGGEDIGVARLDPLGATTWAKRLGGGSYDRPTSLAVDAAGNIFAAGMFEGSATFGTNKALTSAGDYDAFLVKFTAAGKASWAKRFGGAYSDSIMDLAVAPDGSVVVGGSMSTAVSVGGATLAGPGFVAKYSNAGAHVWSRGIGSSTQVGRVAVDESGGVLVSSGTLEASVLVEGGGGSLSTVDEQLFLVKYTSAGAFSWAKTFGGTVQSDLGLGCVTGLANVSGRVVASGHFLRTANFHHFRLGNIGGASTSNKDAFVMSFQDPM